MLVLLNANHLVCARGSEKENKLISSTKQIYFMDTVYHPTGTESWLLSFRYRGEIDLKRRP